MTDRATLSNSDPGLLGWRGAIRKATMTFALAGGMAIAFASGPAAAQSADEPAQSTDTFEMMELLGEVFQRVRENYVEDVSDEELIEAAVRGIMTSLDPHSTYMDQRNFTAMRTNTRGEFGGLGIEVSMDKSGYVRVVSPIDDTPAFRAGLEAGDLVTHLDSEPVQGLTLNEAVDKMRGPVGADITLTILRGEEEPFDVVITRDKIKIQSVRSRAEDKVGYIRITSFNGQTEAGLLRALDRLEEEIGEAPQGYILDLRNNPGGLLDQAVKVSDIFLQKGEIVSTRGREAESIQRFQATAGDATDGKPVVVLINGGSASASEIVAGALQDHGRAIVLGTKSFGKGSVQTIMPLNRNGAAIKLTTQRYYTPAGTSIQATGIEPDILVEPARIEVLERARRRQEADLRGALKNENDTDEATPEDEEAAEADQPQDYQLSRALDLIRGIALYNAGSAN